MQVFALNFETISYCLGISGSIVFVWGIIFKKIETIAEETIPLGAHYSHFKNTVYTKYQTKFGVILLIFALFFTLVAYQFPNTPVFIYPFWGEFSFYAFPYLSIALLSTIIILITKIMAHKKSFPILKDKMQSVYERNKENPEDKSIKVLESLFNVSSKGSLEERMERLRKKVFDRY